MNRFIILFFSQYIINIATFDIPNIYSSYINPNICNSLNINSTNCFYEINIWYYVPSGINKIYFSIPSEEESKDLVLYLGNLINNQLSNGKLIEQNSEKIYEIEREKEKIYVSFIKEQNENKNIIIKHFYSYNNNTYIESKILQLTYYRNYPIELISNLPPQSCLSFYDYDNGQNTLYLISNNNFFIFNINSNSSSINYNTKDIKYLDDLDINNKNEYQIYKNNNYYYIISKMIFIKIDKKDNLLNFQDISSTNQKFIESKIKNDANVYNLEQIEYKNGILMHLFFKYNEGKVCSIEYGCDEPTINGTITYISFFYDGECFLVKSKKEIYKCSFKLNIESNMKVLIYNKLNNRFIDDNEYEILQIRVFPLDENKTNFLFCSLTTIKRFFCTVFNYNHIENDLNSRKSIQIFKDIDNIKAINIFPYRSNPILNVNLIVIVYEKKYSIIDINNSISISGEQIFKSAHYINKDTFFYDLGNNKYIISYISSQSNIGLDMGTIPKSKTILKIIEYYEEYLEISFKELYDENEKLSNENYKVIFMKAIFKTEETNFNPNDIKFNYKDNFTNLKFNDDTEPEYEIKENEVESQKIIIKMPNLAINIFINYTIIGEQFASKNLLKIMNLPKCNEFCSTCDFEIAHLSNETNHYCEKCGNNYEFYYKIENNGKFYNNCYTNCSSENLYYIPYEKECYEKCPEKAPYFILINLECFSECPLGYYQYENSFECKNICPEDYFMDDKNKKCVSICPKGSYGDKNSTKCVINCPVNFYKNNLSNLCVEICAEPLISDNKNKVCVEECDKDLFLYENTNKFCVENCPLNYYRDKLNYKCVNECPEGYYGDNEYYICLKNCEKGYKRDYFSDICIFEKNYEEFEEKEEFEEIENEEEYKEKYGEKFEEENKEESTNIQEIHINETYQIDLNINNNSECLKTIIENYINLIDSDKLYLCNSLKIQIYSNDIISIEKSKEISKNNNMTFIDINNCLDYLIEKNENLNSKKEVIIIIIENQSNSSLINNFNFYVYDLNKNQINLKLCQQNNIPIVLSNNILLNELELDKINYYKDKYSFDITNQNENYFNDICTDLQTKEGFDITMEYRRTKIYKNNICGNNIEFIINYEESSIDCIIPDYNSYIDKKDINPTQNNFFKNLSDTNIIIIKCYYFAFDFSKANKNIANWLILSLFIIKFLCFIVYLFTSTSSIENFLGYWQIFKDTKEINGININNHFIQTLEGENKESEKKIKYHNKKNKKKDIKNGNKNKKNVLESLSTLIQSVKVQRSNKNQIEHNAFPPKKRKDNNNKNNINSGIKIKREEKEFVYQKIDKIIYTKYIDKDDDVISDGCYPVIKIDAKIALKKQEEERKKKEEEERKKKEEERIKKEEEEKIKKEEEEKIKKEEEEKIKKEEEERLKKEEERKKKEEERIKKEEEEKIKKEEEEKIKKEEEEKIKKEEEEKIKKEEEERIKKEEEEKSKKKEEEENKKIEEEKKKKEEEEKKEEEKEKMEEEEKKEKEEEKIKNEKVDEEKEENQRLEEEMNEKEEESEVEKKVEDDSNNKQEEEEKKKREKEKRKEEKKRKEEEKKKRNEDEKRKKEEETKKKKEIKFVYDEFDKRKKFEEEKQKRFKEMKKKREENDQKWKKELERRELAEMQLKKKNKEIIKNKMKQIYERRNYGFDEENNIEFLKKMEYLEKIREKNKEKKRKNEKVNNNKESDIIEEIEHLSKENSFIEIKNSDINDEENNSKNEEEKKDNILKKENENSSDNFEKIEEEGPKKENENSVDNFEKIEEEGPKKENEKSIDNFEKIEEEEEGLKIENNNVKEIDDNLDKEQLDYKNKMKENHTENENMKNLENKEEKDINKKEIQNKDENIIEIKDINKKEIQNDYENIIEIKDINKKEIQNDDENIIKIKDINKKEIQNDDENIIEIKDINDELKEISNIDDEKEIVIELKEINSELKENNNEVKEINNEFQDINNEIREINNEENENEKGINDDNLEENFLNITNNKNTIFKENYDEDDKFTYNDKYLKESEIKEDEKENNNVKIEIKDYSDFESEIVNKRCINCHEKIKSTNRIFLEDEDDFNYQKLETKNNLINVMKQEKNNNYYLSYKEYNLSDYRINNLSYEEAIKIDKRKYFVIYKYYIINSQIILNLFLNPNYLELFCLKIIFFMYILGSEGLFNALLYEDKYINNIYDNNGKFIFLFNFPKSLISTIIAYIINSFLFHLITSRNAFQEAIENKGVKNYQNKFESIMKCLKKKIIFFFIIDFIITGFSWYYCSIFCALYKNTSKYWLISLLISLGIHFLLPFILCFIPATLKYFALKRKNQKIYKLNKFLDLLI